MAGPYLRPLMISAGPQAVRLVAGGDALPLAGSSLAFAAVEVIGRGRSGRISRDIRRLDQVTDPAGLSLLARLSVPRPPLGALDLGIPRLMGILNVTPDSFSDGGQHEQAADAIAHGIRMIEAGAEIVDIGGESTRPGAEPIPPEIEAARVLPVIAGLRSSGLGAAGALLSIDSRRADVMTAAVEAGCGLINDVDALAYDPASRAAARAAGVPVVLMHSPGDPRVMQVDPRYDDVLLDVYDALAERIEAATAAGIARDKLLIDPGIGFGKTDAHNLALLAGLSLFHGLGLPLVLGASRKSFIGRLSLGEGPGERLGGTIAAHLRALAQGVQVLRVHDVAEARQAMVIWRAIDASCGA